MTPKYDVRYGLTSGPAADLTHNSDVAYTTTDDPQRAEEIAAALNTPEGKNRLYAEIIAKPEYAGAERVTIHPARVVEIPD